MTETAVKEPTEPKQPTLDLQTPGLWDLGAQPFPEGWDELSGKPAHRWRLRRDIGGGTAGDDLWFVAEAVESNGSAFLCITPDGSTAGTPDIRDVALLLGEERIAGMLPFELTEVVTAIAREREAKEVSPTDPPVTAGP